MDKKLKKYLYIGVALFVLYLLFKTLGGFVWWIVQTVIYGVLLIALLIFLKRKGFFNNS